MEHLNKSASPSGEDEYLRVLFPRTWTPASRETRDDEPQIASDISRGLWSARQQARLVGADAEARRITVSLESTDVGNVTAVVCLDCLWVAWDDKVVHPWVCLDGVPQEPDIRPMMGAIRIPRQAVNLGNEAWGPYFDTLFPRRLVRDFISYKRSSSGVRIVRRLWDQRELLRVDSPHAAAATAAGAHVGVVLEDEVPGIAHAACLTCVWLGGRGISMREADWRARVALVARQHELDNVPDQQSTGQAARGAPERQPRPT